MFFVSGSKAGFVKQCSAYILANHQMATYRTATQLGQLQALVSTNN